MTRTINHYPWEEKLGFMIMMRVYMDKGLGFEEALKNARASEHIPRKTAREWLGRYGILPWSNKGLGYINEPDWNMLNRYLKPAFHRWTRSRATHGATLLYTY